MTVLRLGALGAARITPGALVQPARDVDGVELVSVAARDHDRARAFAAEHGIAATHPGYEALVESDDVDAVYVALPASEHAAWTIRALQAGKHVLCEKPFALDAEQATAMVAAAVAADRVLVEAYHWRYHPLAERMIELAATIGPLRRVEAVFDAPIPDRADIRHQLSLGGGATMDLGCYPLQWVRAVTGVEPEVTAARATEAAPGVDETMEVDLRAGDATARVRCSMAADATRAAWLRAEGGAGELTVVNPLAPHVGHQVRWRDAFGDHEETVGGRTTYHHQLEAFVAAVRHDVPTPTGGDDAVATMRLIDAVYAAAGLPPRTG